MTSFISSTGRVPNLLINRTNLAAINRSNLEVFRATEQLSSGRAFARPSEDAVAASLVSTLDSRITRSTERLEGLELAEGSLNTLDDALRGSADLLEQARGIGLTQIGSISSGPERAQQAEVVQSILDGLLRTVNTQSSVGHVFGGTRPGEEPVTQVGRAYRFDGSTEGLVTDATSAGSVPVTLAASNALGAVSARVESVVDLDPDLTAQTRLSEVRGAAGLGVSLGTVRFSAGGGPVAEVDLSAADTADDVVNRLTEAITAYEADNAVTVLGPGGVTIGGEGFSFDVPAGDLEFFDIPGSVTARDLGLRSVPAAPFNAGNPSGAGIEPLLTFRTPVSALSGLAAPLGQISVTQNGVTQTVDLSGAATVGDIRSILESEVEGLRVEINDAGSGLRVVSELSGATSSALSIGEVVGGTTATDLGIRTLDTTTSLSAFNFGRGVTAVEGQTDFTIHIADGGTPAEQLSVDIDLRPEDLASVATVIARIESEVDAALLGATPPRLATEFTAGLVDAANGITLTQTGLTGVVRVEQKNNSPAAEQLGLLDGVWDPANTRLIGEDRAQVRAESAFSALSDLRDALAADDRFGIQLAVDALEDRLDETNQSRALVGGFTNRLEAERSREESRLVVDQEIRANARDVDFTEAATRLTLLQTQLEAGLRTTAISNQLSLLDFL